MENEKDKAFIQVRTVPWTVESCLPELTGAVAKADKDKSAQKQDSTDSLTSMRTSDSYTLSSS